MVGDTAVLDLSGERANCRRERSGVFKRFRPGDPGQGQITPRTLYGNGRIKKTREIKHKGPKKKPQTEKGRAELQVRGEQGGDNGKN